ncbi:hypothetical protein SAMN02910297_00553 [Methanobrevibacter olleyae]|uniref:Uncharacterized protein n=1 Tax=Methanobrevibacter olleyae TaxID=294671 RepID=A0A126R3C9_METOL|nr:hypothetical protein YLM1_1600 [Methanobrevibacter olleyae]SFL31844.1 hypothetical protein SAMN02910297_00553 [Methanobrevibacter olleyae]
MYFFAVLSSNSLYFSHSSPFQIQFPLLQIYYSFHILEGFYFLMMISAVFFIWFIFISISTIRFRSFNSCAVHIVSFSKNTFSQSFSLLFIVFYIILFLHFLLYVFLALQLLILKEHTKFKTFFREFYHYFRYLKLLRKLSLNYFILKNT